MKRMRRAWARKCRRPMMPCSWRCWFGRGGRRSEKPRRGRVRDNQRRLCLRQTRSVCAREPTGRNDGKLLGGLFGFAEISLISALQTILKRGAGAPAEFRQPGDIEQFARGAIGARGVV